MKVIWMQFFLLLLVPFFSLPALAASYADPIGTLPRNSLVTVRYELEVPANHEYVVLGQSMTDQIGNSLSQTLNAQNQLFRYNDYRYWMAETYEETYGDCLERHQRYVNTGGINNHVVIEQNIYTGQYPSTTETTIINQNITTPADTVSYIGPNNCVPPDYTMSFLMVKSSGNERLIAAGKGFKVDSVRTNRRGYFYEVFIRFQHKVVTGIKILTTHDPGQISIAALDSGSGGGFWATVGQVLTGIAGNNLKIALTEAEYIE